MYQVCALPLSVTARFLVLRYKWQDFDKSEHVSHDISEKTMLHWSDGVQPHTSIVLEVGRPRHDLALCLAATALPRRHGLALCLAATSSPGSWPLCPCLFLLLLS